MTSQSENNSKISSELLILQFQKMKKNVNFIYFGNPKTLIKVLLDFTGFTE